MLSPPYVIAHRGASGSAPENTLRSYELAFEMGAQMFELDVQESQDGSLVCIHDYEVDRTTNGTGAVSDMNIEELRALDAGQGERIPLLSEALDLARGRMLVNIELKVLDVEARVLELVRERRMTQDVLISSFFHDTLAVVRELDESVRTAALVSEEEEDPLGLAVGLSVNAINPYFGLATLEFVNEAHDRGLSVYPWTVNHEDTMTELIALGVDGIITDYPEVCLDIIRTI
ncbi:MAG: glycerophosphodiester phosphodiesterase [Candidatus Thorarchaeota archaeon]